jgi:hypothetical protein
MQNLPIFFIAPVFLWLIFLTVIFLRFYLYYLRIAKDAKRENLAGILDKIEKREEKQEDTIRQIEDKIKELRDDGVFHIQKVGLLRFNPFKDTGGDQSFILALLDKEDSGVVISSLHTRTGTRWYAKRVVKGNSIEYDLSEEEVKAIKIAKEQKR